MPAPVPTEFARVLEQWHDVFLLTGTAAVTLIGLLFVSLSFNLDVLLHESRAHLIVLARQAFSGFIYAMVVSLFCLEPIWSPRRMGVTFVFFGLVQLGLWGRGLFEMRRADHSELGFGHVLRRSLGGLVASLMLMAGGWSMLAGAPDALQLIALALIFLLATGARSAWDLLVRVGRVRETAKVVRDPEVAAAAKRESAPPANASQT